jgi:hypothetical protein
VVARRAALVLNQAAGNDPPDEYKRRQMLIPLRLMASVFVAWFYLH